ncbi:MAG: ribonuclease E/G, partial [Hyphococcus sp.]
MKMLMPSHAKNVQPYKDRAPIFLKHNVESQLDGMYQPTVRLKSGGYIVIHQTEALVAIDVNSGRATRERNIELTALKTNIEAAQEAARQFRLRDLAGLIVLDFIDMEEPKNNRKVEKALKEALKSDRARIQAGRISNFGLLEMSRQRRRSGIVDGTTHACPTCSGAGVVRSHETAALRILRAIEGEAISGKVGRITVRASLDVSLHILNHNREWLERIEDANGVKVEILADSDKAGDAFDLEKSGAPVERKDAAAFVRPDQTEPVEIEEETADEDKAASEEEQRDGARKRRRRRKRRKDGDDVSVQDGSEVRDSGDAGRDEDDAGDAQASGDDGEEDAPRKKRRRGRRGGRRNRKNTAKDGAEASDPSADANASSDRETTSAGSANGAAER